MAMLPRRCLPSLLAPLRHAAPAGMARSRVLSSPLLATTAAATGLLQARWKQTIPAPRHTHINGGTGPRPKRGWSVAPRLTPTWPDPEAAAREALMQFIDPYEVDADLGEPGRQWRAAELRLKSNEDLQKLWVVLLKERNMLETTRLHHKKRGTEMPHKIRIRHVRKSMAMVKVVLGERQREKALSDAEAFAERQRDAALEQLDLAAAAVFPPWIPGTDRELQLAAPHTFSVLLRTSDRQPPKARPPGDALALTLLTEDGSEELPGFDVRVSLRPPLRSRPAEVSYACHAVVAGDALPRERFLASPSEVGEPVRAQIACTLYGEPVGGGPVPVLLLPSKKLLRRVAMAEINKGMSERFVRARENAQAEL